MRLRLLALLALSVLLWSGQALGLGGPENVLVVRNGNSPVSCRIADYYVSRRHIPDTNLVTVYTLDSSLSASNECIAPQDYQTKIEEPIRSFLTTKNLVNQIQYIVMTKGVPHRLTSGTWGGKCVDSLLAAIDLVNPLVITLEWDNRSDTTFANRYWRAAEPFTHAAYGGYLVTRLDGYTEADAKALVHRALAAQSTPYCLLLDIDAARGLGDPSVQPRSILRPDGTLDPNYSLDYFDYNADMTRASQVISGRPLLSVELESTDAFVSGSHPLAGYVSWGSNDSHYSASTYLSVGFAPGGIAETAVSSSGRTFLPTTGGQSLIVDLIAHGAAGAKGYVTEPFLDAVASPTVLFDLYTSGRNLAESYYAASRFVGWKDVVVGDPLCCLAGTMVNKVADAKALPDGTLVSVADKVVSAGTDDFSDRFYIEELDRSSGIGVYIGKAFPGICRGMVVSVRGVLATRDGERMIVNPSIVSAAAVGGASSKTTTKSNATGIYRRVKPLK